MFQSQISCHTFPHLSQPRPLWNWIMKTCEIPKELGLFYVAFLTVWWFIQLEQFVFLQVALPTPSHQVPSNFMLVSKILHLNLFNIVTLLTLKVVLGYQHTRLKTILTIFKYKLSSSALIETIIWLSQLYVHFQNKIPLNLFINILVMFLLPY